MYTQKQNDAILEFFSVNKEILKSLYQHLIDNGVSTDKKGNILIKTKGITRRLICNEEFVIFSSKRYYKDSEPELFGDFYSWNDMQQTLRSSYTNGVGVFKHSGEFDFEQETSSGSFRNTDIVSFYELSMIHIPKIQNELNIFTSHFVAPIFALKPISEFISESLLHEEMPKDPSNMKLRDYGFTTIVASAIQEGNYVFLGITHDRCMDGFKVKYSDVYDEDYCRPPLYHGYIDSNGIFVMPGKAWEIADKAGQIDENFQSFTHFSEDLYQACKSEFDITYAKKKITENLKLKLLENKERLIESISPNIPYNDKRKLQNTYVVELTYGIDEYTDIPEGLEKIKAKILNTLAR